MQITRPQLFVQLSVLLATVCVVFLLIGGAADAGSPPLPSIEHVVGRGETLWDIAADYAAPEDDVRVLISEIRERSGLATSALQPGQILLIPRG